MEKSLLSGLTSNDPKFTESEWDRLIQQAVPTIQILRN